MEVSEIAEVTAAQKNELQAGTCKIDRIHYLCTRITDVEILTCNSHYVNFIMYIHCT